MIRIYNSYDISNDDRLIFESGSTIDDYYLTSAKLTEEINQSGYFEFSIPSTSDFAKQFKGNKYFSINPNDMVPFINPIVITENDKIIWIGRILRAKVDFYGNVDCMAEGQMSSLSYAITDISDLKDVLKSYNNKITISEFISRIFSSASNKPSSPDDFTKLPYNLFYISNIIVGENIGREKISVNLENENDICYLKNLINDYLLTPFGGYLTLANDYISLTNPPMIQYLSYEDLPKRNDVSLDLNSNIIDFSLTLDGSTVKNGIVGYGQNNFCLTKSITDEYYLKNQLGIISYEIKYFDDVQENDTSSLNSKMDEFLNSVRSGGTLNVDLTINAVDPSYLNLRQDLSINRIKVGEIVRVKSSFHGIDEYLLCSKITRDLLQPENTEFQLGASTPKISDNRKDYIQKYNYSIDFSHKGISDINKKLN